MSLVISADRLTKRYGSRLAVDDVSFEVASGEVLGLLGPNGSGKSTILRMLTGYLQPSSGRASIAGFDMSAQSLQARQQIGYVPEDAPLYSHMRVDEFLAFMGGLKGLAGKQRSTAIAKVSAQLSLDSVRKLTINKLSRGYRQRVALAQALLNDPPLLILDEPTNGLDPRQIIEVRELIGLLAERHTILITSHILSEIERVANRVAILLEGRLLSVQTLAQQRQPKLLLRVQPQTGSETPDQVREILNAIPGVLAVNAAEAFTFTVDIERAECAAPLAAAVTGAGFGLLEMSEVHADLEQLFLQLTKENA